MSARDELYRRVSGAFVTEGEANTLLGAVRVEVLAEVASESPQPATDLALPWAAAMDDSDLHEFLGDLVSAAIGRWQSDPDLPDREVLAAIEKACANWRTPGQGLRPEGDFFQPGHGYTRRDGTDFLCVAVTTHPASGERLAIGWNTDLTGLHFLVHRHIGHWLHDYDGCKPPEDDTYEATRGEPGGAA